MKLVLLLMLCPPCHRLAALLLRHRPVLVTQARWYQFGFLLPFLVCPRHRPKQLKHFLTLMRQQEPMLIVLTVLFFTRQRVERYLRRQKKL